MSRDVVTWINVDKNGVVKDWNYHELPDEFRFRQIPDFDTVYNHVIVFKF